MGQVLSICSSKSKEKKVVNEKPTVKPKPAVNVQKPAKAITKASSPPRTGRKLAETGNTSNKEHLSPTEAARVAAEVMNLTKINETQILHY